MNRVELPIDPYLPQIAREISRARSLVIVAPPGAGKTTRVPVAMLEARVMGREHPHIVMLQPRRVAARAAAARIAVENGWELGRQVGYHVRFDRKIGPDTRLRVVTEGILTRQLLEDPFLEGIGAVILDEFHERSLHTDLAIALLREVQETVRPDLKIVVMSATLEAEPVAKFLGNCPIIHTQGRTYPIEIQYKATVRGQEIAGAIEAVAAEIEEGGRGLPIADRRLPIGENAEGKAGLDRRSGHGRDGRATGGASGDFGDVQSAIGNRQSAIAGNSRDLLIFMPGAEEIRRVIQALEPLAQRENLLLVPLHGTLTGDEQDVAIRPDPHGRRKVIVATNIAETSLTIEGVGVVIDSGLARVAGYDPERGLDRLEVERISRASATQRAGRAGRTGPGLCIRLWSEKEWERMDAFALPEIKRVDLCATVLELAAWGKNDPHAFGWYEPPEPRMLGSAQDLLTMLGAIDLAGKITRTGEDLARLPVHPRLARLMVEAAEQGLLKEGATVAALISEKDILRTERFDRGALMGRGRMIASSDLIVRLQHLEHDPRDPDLDRQSVKQVLRVREELIRMGERIEGKRRGQEDEGGRGLPIADRRLPIAGSGSSSQSAIAPQSAIGNRQSAIPQSPISDLPPEDLPLLRLILWAYPDRVCRRRGAHDRGVMVGGGGVKIADESAVKQGEFFVAIDARQDQRSASREALVRIASLIDVSWLEEMFPSQVRREQKAEFDEARQRITGVVRVWYRDLLLREDKDVPVDAATAAEMLREVVRQQAPQLFGEDESATPVLRRLALLRQHMPEHPWPAWDDAELGDLLASSLGRARSLREVKELSLASILKSSLHYPLDRLLESEAPEAIEVPSGSHIRLRYSATEVVLAVRLQELFGMLDTPRIAGGRVPVKLELLAPNYRPVQVTMDLRSFWSTTYFQVKKDLKARYPKHAWPENPLTAKAECKGGRRRS